MLDKVIGILKSGKRLPIRECCICGHMLTYLWYNNGLAVDTNCNCVNYIVEPRVKNIEELNIYLEQEHYVKLWGLNK